MRKVILVVAAVLVVSMVWAQSDAKAKKILEDVSAKAKTFKSMSADFTFTMKNEEMDIDEKNDGSIKVKGQKYCVLLPGVGVEIFSNGTTVWNYMKDGNQVTISDIDDDSSDLMNNPSSLFSIYERGFRSEFVSEKKEGGKTLYKINLFPDSEEYEVTKIEVAINKASMMINDAKLYGTDGNIYGIVVKKMNTSSDFVDSDFIFNETKYPDVEMIDLR